MSRLTLSLFILISSSSCDRAPVDASGLPEPVQAGISNERPATNNPNLRSVASFDAKVLILSRKKYAEKPSDPLSAFSPYDIAVAWGEAGLAETRQGLKIVQVNRRYAWSFGR